MRRLAVVMSMVLAVVGLAAPQVAAPHAAAQGRTAGSLPPVTWDYVSQFAVMDLGKAAGAPKLSAAKVATIVKPQCKAKAGAEMILSANGVEVARAKGTFDHLDVPKSASKPLIMDPEGSYGTWQVGCFIRYHFAKVPSATSYQAVVTGGSSATVTLKELKHYDFFIRTTVYPPTPCSYSKPQGLACT